MKKKLPALILVFALLFSTFPAFACPESIAVDEKIVGSAPNPLIVNYDWWKGIKYVSLGDSIAYGYALEGAGIDIADMVDENMKIIPKMASVAHRTFKKRVNGSYPDLIQDYFEKNRLADPCDYLQGAVCSSRIDDVCTFIDSERFPADNYCQNVLLDYIIGRSAAQVNREIGGAVKNADLITITAGGNNILCYPVANLVLKGWDAKGDLKRYYGSSADSFYNTKNAAIEKVRRLDQQLKSGGYYEKKVNAVFDILEAVMYTSASFVYNEKNLLDLIHSVNRDAVVAVTGIPTVGYDYDIRVGSLIIDLEKALSPLEAVLNTMIKNDAESRSSYVRFIDMTGIDLFEAGEDKKIVDIEDVVGFVLNNMQIAHPTYEGHLEIANRIMENFKFSAKCEMAGKISNQVNNYKTTVRSRVGISKIDNLTEKFEAIDLKGVIRFEPACPV